MFQKVEVPILGIVENMSTFHCPQCGHESHIFGHGGARQDAARFGVPFLGEVPLHMSIRETSDAGRPIGVSEPDGPHAKVFASMAGSIWADVLARKAGKRQPPVIIIEDELS
jgi:ATP-binding protein involved in chromosome partitioning